jgi:hypothetical protein
MFHSGGRMAVTAGFSKADELVNKAIFDDKPD